LQQLLDSSNLGIRSLSITVVVRQSDQAALFGKKGIKTYIVTGLDDAEGLEIAASEADIVVNAASSQHPGAPTALIQGLSKSRAQTGQDVFFIHVRTLCHEINNPNIFVSSSREQLTSPSHY
jgi:hypothetical protein